MAVASRLERSVTGVLCGLVVTLGSAFAASSCDMPLAQTGLSPGKLLFFGVWAVVLVGSLRQPLLRRTIAYSLLASGLLLAAAAAVSVGRVDPRWLAHPAFLGVELVLAAFALGFCVLGLRLLRSPVT